MKLLLLIPVYFFSVSLYAQLTKDLPFKGYFGGYEVFKELEKDSIESFIFPQEDVPFVGYFGGYGLYKNLKNDSIGNLFIPNCDTNIIIYTSKNLNQYRMYNKTHNLISEGSLGEKLFTDYVLRFGKWTAYFPETGKPKIIGYFYQDDPTGLWQYFYPNGQLKRMFSLAQIESHSITLTRKVGLYEEYYENGQLKISGYYQIKIDTTSIEKYINNPGYYKKINIKGPVSRPYGIWQYYSEYGKLENQKEFK